MVLAAVSSVFLAVSAALAVDLGRQAWGKRDIQAVADMAALDAARVLKDLEADPLGAVVHGPADVLDAARASATRNEFDWADEDGGQELTVVLGSFEDDPSAYGFTALCPPAPPAAPCAAAPLADAVRVTVGTDVDYVFMGGGRHLTATATARLPLGSGSGGTPDGSGSSTGGGGSGGGGTSGASATGEAGIHVASTTASVDSSEAALLNLVLEEVLDPGDQAPGSVQVSAAGWQGLATSTVSLDALAGNAGVATGTVDEVLDADVTIGQLFTAAAAALDQDGDAGAAATVLTLAAQLDASLPSVHRSFRLGDLVDAGGAEAFTGSAVAATTVNVLDLARAGAVLADGDHLVSTPVPVELTPAGATSAVVTLSLVEAPRTAWGPPDATGLSTAARTAQVTSAVRLTVPVTISGLGVLDVTFDVSVTGGGGEAFLTGLACSDTTATSADLLGRTRSLEVSTGAFSASIAGLVTVSKEAGAPLQSAGSSGTFSFPDPFTAVHTVGPDDRVVPAIDTGAITVVGGPLLDTAGIKVAVATQLNVVLGGLDDALLAPLYDGLGVGWSDADLRVLHPEPGSPADGPAPVCTATTSSGSTTTTVPSTTSTTVTDGTTGTPGSLGDTPQLVE